MSLFLASPVAVVVLAIYLFKLEKNTNKTVFKVIFAFSALASPFCMFSYESITEGLGFGIFLIPWYYTKWLGILLCLGWAIYHVYRREWGAWRGYTVTVVYLLVYLTQTPVMNYISSLRY